MSEWSRGKKSLRCVENTLQRETTDGSQNGVMIGVGDHMMETPCGMRSKNELTTIRIDNRERRIDRGNSDQRERREKVPESRDLGGWLGGGLGVVWLRDAALVHPARPSSVWEGHCLACWCCSGNGECRRGGGGGAGGENELKHSKGNR